MGKFGIYGWKRDQPDGRDYRFALPQIELPSLVDMRAQCPAIYDQGPFGSCTANAACGAFEFDLLKQGLTDFAPSRLFEYYNTRVLDGDVHQDGGGTIRNANKALAKKGVCDEQLWPYKGSLLLRKPPKSGYKAALPNRITQYMAVSQDVASMKATLASGLPIQIGFTVYDSFESNAVAATGIVPMPNLASEGVLGGHAVLIVGFGDSITVGSTTLSNVWIVRNSWGANWGDCLGGETKIALLNGTEPTLFELAERGSAVWVYAYNNRTGRIEPALAHPKCSGWRDDMMRVTLDNGERVLCSSDHEWMLRDGTFLAARYLKVGQSLMPLYRKDDRGYERFLDPKSHRWVTTHWSVVRMLGKKVVGDHVSGCERCEVVVHHYDFNERNNEPDNLIPMWTCAHQTLHRKIGTSLEKVEKLKERWRVQRDVWLPNSIRNITEYNDQVKSGEVALTEAQREARSANGRHVGKLPHGPVTEAQREVRRKNARVMLEKRIPKATSTSFKPGHVRSPETVAQWRRTMEAKKLNNHKVVSIEYVPGVLPVYDLKVEHEGANFALAAGAFVHNSGYFYMPYDYFINPNLASDLWVIQTVP